jgi:phage shock protein PspC (stress-responsive transcriptional regulator)
MRRVVTISLNGNAYALEEDAADALGDYLESARLALQGNADLAEILADLEQAIAEKSQRFLGAHKTVLTRAEINQVLTEMGPVAHEPNDAADAAQARSSAPPRHARQTLYRIRQGEQIGGVCNGLAAYFGLDVTWVRLAFVLFTFLWGVTLIVYLVLWLILPLAETPEELAAAYGEPFNAREYVERARREARRLGERDWSQGTAELKAEWQRSARVVRSEVRESLRNWRERRRAARRRRSVSPAANPAVPPAQAAPKTHALQQVLIVFLTLPFIVLFGGIALVWIMAMFALITTGTLFGLLLPFSLPIWLAILFLLMVFGLITWPLRLLMRLIAHGQPAVAMQPAFSFIESLVGLAAFVAITFWAYHHVPAVADLIDTIRDHVEGLLHRLHGDTHVIIES